jgi:hypothetical protein
MADSDQSSQQAADTSGDRTPASGVERMNDLEYLMWLLESDPLLTAQFANLTKLDSVPDIERLRARLDRAAQIVPRLHQRVEEAPARLAAPSWRRDPDYHIDRHFRVTALPERYRRPAGWNSSPRTWTASRCPATGRCGSSCWSPGWRTAERRWCSAWITP